MADPTEDQIRLQMGRSVLWLEELRQLAEADATNLIGIEDTLVVDLIGDYSPEVLAGMQTSRALVSQALAPASVQAQLSPHLLNYGKLIGSPESDPSLILRDLYDYFVANSFTVEERGFTFAATPSAGGSNVGDGVLNRLNVDENGVDIDTQTADLKTATCIRDEHSGAQEHSEVFEIAGAERLRDYLSLKGGSGQPGSVPKGTLTALTGRDSQAFLQNPSFTQTPLTVTAGGSTAATANDNATGWTMSDFNEFTFSKAASETYRDSMGEGVNSTALRIDGNVNITQNLNVRRAQFPQTQLGGFGQEIAPIYVQVAYNADPGSGDGALTLAFGGVSVTIADVTAGAGWLIARVAIGASNWIKAWNQEDLAVTITLAGNTTGYVLVDDVIIAPFQPFDGGWWALVGGATPFLRDDLFTASDTVTETGDINKWLVRGFNRYLPSTGGAATWDDPPPTPSPTPSPTPTPT